MAVDFSFNNIVQIISNELFGGNTTIGGLVIMMAAMFIMIAILANLKAPVYFALVPGIILAIIFSTMGIMDMTVSFMIIILSAVILAAAARRTIGG